MRTRTRLSGTAVGVTVAVLTSLALAGPASAAVTDEAGPEQATAGLKGAACVAAAREWTDHAVARRLVRIAELRTSLAAATRVSAAHRGELEATFAADRSGLKAVRTEVRQDSTCSEATKDARKVVTKYRVYRLLTPQTSLTIRGDHGLFRAQAYLSLVPGYASAIEALPDGASKVAAGVALADLITESEAAQASYEGISDTVLALVPADFPSQAAVLSAADAAAAAGHASLVDAAVDRAILDALLG